MRLAVISDLPHHRADDGRPCTIEPVVNQLDRWASLFDEVVLCVPVDPGPPPAGFAPYRSANVRLERVSKAGGNTRRAKLGLLLHVLPWAWRTRRIARQVDAVYLRCPSNVGLVAIFSTWRAARHRYALYAGVWRGYDGEPPFYALQRWLLGSPRFGGPVSVYAAARQDRPHLEPFFSSSFTREDWLAAAPGVDAKLARITGGVGGTASDPWRLVAVGRLTPNKNQQVVLRAVAEVRDRGVEAVLDVYGDGPERPRLERLAAELGLGDRIRFHGSVDHREVMDAFARADLQLLGTRQEGYGKVLLEGMLHGTVPVFSDSPVAPEIAGDGTRGRVVGSDDHGAFARAVVELTSDRARWARMAKAARDHTADMTLEAFAERVQEMLERQWGVRFPPRAGGRRT